MDRKKEVEQIVTSFLPKEEGYQKTVLEAMITVYPQEENDFVRC